MIYALAIACALLTAYGLFITAMLAAVGLENARLHVENDRLMRAVRDAR